MVVRCGSPHAYDQLIKRWHLFDSRRYEIDWSIAVLLRSGCWISPISRDEKIDLSESLKANRIKSENNADYGVRAIYRG